MGNVSISANKEFIIIVIIIIIIMHWKLPNMTHYNLLPTINSSLTINTAFEKRSAKFIYSCLNSDYLIIKSTSISAMATHCSQIIKCNRSQSQSSLLKHIAAQELKLNSDWNQVMYFL